jgi:hypothetical protein
MTTKLILNSKLNFEKKRRFKLELQNDSLSRKFMLCEQFIKKVSEMEEPKSRIEKLSSAIKLQRIIKSAKQIKKELQNEKI